jgi:hypothetical protein
MSLSSIEDKLKQIHNQLNANYEKINELGRSFETYKVAYNFWIKMIIQKIFTDEELEEINKVEKTWYELAFNMPSRQPLNLVQLELLLKYKLIDGAQMTHMLSRIEE